jgi:adenylate cyclase
MGLPSPIADDVVAPAGAKLLDAGRRRRRRVEWRIVGALAGVGAAGGFVAGWSSSSDPTDPLDLWLSGAQGVVTALAVSVPLLWLEVAGGRTTVVRRLRRLPAWAFFLAKLGLYLAIIVTAIHAARALFDFVNPQPFGFDRSFFESGVIAAAWSLGANAVVEVGRLIGFSELRRLLSGRYLQPREERRVFLIVDLKESSAAARRLGDLRYLRLLDAFFDDVADVALDHGAEIHKYVGDEAILTWLEASALDGARCALCPLALAQRVREASAEYRRSFGFVPSFRAVLHSGLIVAGEIGGLKRELAFVGDTLNTAARLLDVSRESGEDVVLSSALAARLHLPNGLTAVPLGDVRVRGKDGPLSVVALRPTWRAP